jgi:hypothetical protein
MFRIRGKIELKTAKNPIKSMLFKIIKKNFLLKGVLFLSKKSADKVMF